MVVGCGCGAGALTLLCSCHAAPTLAVDGMACLRHWYTCEDWVCGGQWREYMDILSSWVETFTSAGIRLVFFFDGVVEEHKRAEWVREGPKDPGHTRLLPTDNQTGTVSQMSL